MRPHKPVKAGPSDTDESTDAYDTIEWLLKNVPGHNGRVGTWGISYPGFYAACGMLDAHPALKAVSPQAPPTDWFLGDDTHHNGALFLHQEFNFDAVFGWPRPAPTTKEPPAFVHIARMPTLSSSPWGPVSQAQPLLQGPTALLERRHGHGTYDAFWKERSLLPHLKDVRPAVLTVGGWFDAEDLFGITAGLPGTGAGRPRGARISGHGTLGPRRLGRRRR